MGFARLNRLKILCILDLFADNLIGLSDFGNFQPHMVLVQSPQIHLRNGPLRLLYTMIGLYLVGMYLGHNSQLSRTLPLQNIAQQVNPNNPFDLCPIGKFQVGILFVQLRHFRIQNYRVMLQYNLYFQKLIDSCLPYTPPVVRIHQI